MFCMCVCALICNVSSHVLKKTELRDVPSCHLHNTHLVDVLHLDSCIDVLHLEFICIR